MKEAYTYKTDRYKIDSEAETSIWEKKFNEALISMLCGILIILTVLGSFLVRGCLAAPAVADCLCEQCGEIIGTADYGRCHKKSDRIYVRAIVDQQVARANGVIK
jgi:hypothetical protein